MPEYGPRPAQPSKLDAFKPYLEERLRAGARNARVLLRELCEQNYAGRYTILTDWLRPPRSGARVVAVRRFETAPGKQAPSGLGLPVFGTLAVCRPRSVGAGNCGGSGYPHGARTNPVLTRAGTAVLEKADRRFSLWILGFSQRFDREAIRLCPPEAKASSSASPSQQTDF